MKIDTEVFPDLNTGEYVEFLKGFKGMADPSVMDAIFALDISNIYKFVDRRGVLGNILGRIYADFLNGKPSSNLADEVVLLAEEVFNESKE